MKYIRRFVAGLADGERDPAVLGGKGAALAVMSQEGIPVPPGFTIVVACCRIFLETGQWPEGLDEELDQAMQWLEESTGCEFGDTKKPLLVSVRSGAPISMPGMMDTLLNLGVDPSLAPGDARSAAVYENFAGRFATVTGSRPPAEPRAALRAGIEAVWNSWRSPRAGAYRQRHGISATMGTAVNVQSMFPSAISGVVFTVDPNHPESGELVIEAAFGLGESVVSGEVTPDSYRVAREDLRVSHVVIGRKGSTLRALGDESRHEPDARCLDDAALRELSELCLGIEKLQGDAVDVEFGWANGSFAILQSRRIRGLDVARAVEPEREAMIARLEGQADGKQRVWVRHNLDETLSHPTTLTWDVMSGFMGGRGGFGRLYHDLGYRSGAAFSSRGFLELIGGRVFADPERAATLFWDGMPLTYDPQAVLADPRVIERPPTVFVPEAADPAFLCRLPANVMSMVRVARRTGRLRNGALARFVNEILPPYEEFIATENARDLRALDDAAMLQILEERRRRVMDEFGGESLKPGFFGGVAHSLLLRDLRQIFGEDKGRELSLRLIMGLEGDITFEQNLLLHEIANGRADRQEFLDRFGHRAVHEMELSTPRWREDAEGMDLLISRMVNAPSPKTIHEKNRERRLETEADLPRMLREAGASTLRESVEEKMRLSQDLLPWRENGKYHLMRGYALIRDAALTLGERWDLGEDVFHLKWSELAEFPKQSTELRETIARRKLRREAWKRLDMPMVIDSSNMRDLGLPRQIEGGTEWVAEPISAGVVEGTAQVIFDPSGNIEVHDDLILVCPSTDPAWTSLFAMAKGLVMERGGALSHGAIVARDFGLPAVVCPDATRLIKNGDRLRLDGNSGRIAILPPQSASTTPPQ